MVNLATKPVAAGLAILLTGLSLQGCATGRMPELPSRAEYEQSCSDLFSKYKSIDARAQNRRQMSYSADSAIALTAIGIAVATSGAAGPGVPIGAIVLSQVKGDLGHEKIARDRSKLQQMAIRKGCTTEDIVAFEAGPPVANAEFKDDENTDIASADLVE